VTFHDVRTLNPEPFQKKMQGQQDVGKGGKGGRFTLFLQSRRLLSGSPLSRFECTSTPRD
jgi:hypothetical protein